MACGDCGEDPDEIADLSHMQVSLGALMCCIHLTKHAQAAGIGAAEAAGEETPTTTSEHAQMKTDCTLSA